MVQANRTSTNIIDCACVIHGSGYNWQYVEKLYNMLNRGLRNRMRLHVYTEAARDVPAPMIKHELEEWPELAGPKRSWWYKLQLFNSEHHRGNLLYFDLDTIIVRDITWITELPSVKLWTIRDFRQLQSENYMGMNSSIMWWNVHKYNWVWQEFKEANKKELPVVYPDGDQQYLWKKLGVNEVRFFPDNKVQSWRWQTFDGGYDFERRQFYKPGQGTKLDDQVSVLIFHGQPKPHELLDDVVIKQHWH